jgi:hypothetical protein
MATSPLSLPAELLHDIVLYMDRGSLISLARSCRILHAVAVEHLHRTVPRLSGPDTIRCLNTLATTPDLAGKVRTFNIYSSFAGPYITEPQPRRAELPRKSVWDRLFATFRPTKSTQPAAAMPRLHFFAGTERMSPKLLRMPSTT